MTERTKQNSGSFDNFWKRFPWWFVAAVVVLGAVLAFMLATPSYREAFQFIAEGMSLTVTITLGSFFPALLTGILVGIGYRSRNILIQNLARFYLAIIGGIPTIVMLVSTVWLLPTVGEWVGLDSSQVPANVGAILGLTIAYSAIFADVFRLGYRDAGDQAAAMPSGRQQSTLLIAVGVTTIALLKDSSLAAFLGLRDIYQYSRLYIGQTFRFGEGFVSAILLYLILTIPLRFLLEQLEQRLNPAKH